MDGFVALAMEEERQLAAVLSKNPVYIKLEAVRALLRAYSDEGRVSDDTAHDGGDEARARVRLRPGIGKSSVAGQVRALVIPYLKETGTRVQSNKILEFVQEKGVVLGGQNQLATLASYLSGTPELDNVRGLGYGLKEWSDTQTVNSDTLEGAKDHYENNKEQIDDGDTKVFPSDASNKLFG